MARPPSTVFAPGGEPKSAPAPRSKAPQTAVKPAPRDGVLQRLKRRLQSLLLHGALGDSGAELLRIAVRRSRTSLTCTCGGRAERVRSRRAELRRFGGEGFARAFVCAACHTRYVARAKPRMPG